MQAVKETFDERFIALGEKYVDWFAAGNFELEHMVKFPSHLEVLHELYSILAKKGKIIRLEKLDLDVKNNIWNECKKYIETLSTKDRIKFCKGYWALNYLAQNRTV